MRDGKVLQIQALDEAEDINWRSYVYVQCICSHHLATLHVCEVCKVLWMRRGHVVIRFGSRWRGSPLLRNGSDLSQLAHCKTVTPRHRASSKVYHVLVKPPRKSFTCSLCKMRPNNYSIKHRKCIHWSAPTWVTEMVYCIAASYSTGRTNKCFVLMSKTPFNNIRKC